MERKRCVPAESAPVGAFDKPAEAATPEEPPPTEGEEGPKKRRHKNTGWCKEMPRIFSRHMLGNPQTDSEAMGPDDRKVLKEKMMTHLGEHLDEWHHQREVAPLGFGQYLYDTFFKVNGIHIESFKSDTRWIQPGSWYHKAIIDNGELDQVEHLKDAPPPGRNVQRPSIQTLSNLKLAFETAYKDTQDSVDVLVNIQTNLEANHDRFTTVQTDHEEAKTLAREIDTHLANVASQYAQMLRILGKSDRPARRPRPLEAFPLLMLPPPPQDVPQLSEATPQQGVPSRQGTPLPAVTPSSEASPGTHAGTPPREPTEEEELWSPARRSYKRTRGDAPSSSSGKYLTADVLRDRQGMLESLSHMLEAVGELTYPTCPKLYEVICKVYPGQKAPYWRRLSNEVYCCIQYHLLLSACRRADDWPILISEKIRALLPPLEG